MRTIYTLPWVVGEPAEGYAYVPYQPPAPPAPSLITMPDPRNTVSAETTVSPTLKSQFLVFTTTTL